MVIVGAARDVEVINTFDLGSRPGDIAHKDREVRRGERGVTLNFGGVEVRDGDFLAADENGVGSE